MNLFLDHRLVTPPPLPDHNVDILPTETIMNRMREKCFPKETTAVDSYILEEGTHRGGEIFDTLYLRIIIIIIIPIRTGMCHLEILCMDQI